MNTNSARHSYSIQNNTFYFHTGRLSDGGQAILGVQMPTLLMVKFDADGNYVEVVVKDFPPDLSFDELSEHLKSWRAELGITPATISVKQFFLKDIWVGIQDLPDHYLEVLRNPENFDAEELAELQEDIRIRQEQGDFVFYWCEDYYLDRSGEVTSS
ncbi:MAG: hypothetical protein ABIY70_26135 [Capsulimonas sp.]|uniref:hypothetical protein n=1 Tax=Capsulimonas sp. TaxID=2494211 RepID=UPI003263D737